MNPAGTDKEGEDRILPRAILGTLGNTQFEFE